MADTLLTFCGIIFTFVAVVWGAYYFFRFEDFDVDRLNKFLQKNEENKAFIIGHRGTMVGAPENTLQAFRAAAEGGADAVEFDVLFTKDGHGVIMHDDTVDRTTNGTGRVCDYTLEEIRKLDAIGEFKNSKDDAFVQIPTLEEAIQTCLELKLKMFIELKYAAQAAEVLNDLFRKYNIYEKAIVLSFYPDMLYKIRKADPKIMICQNWIKRHMSYNRDGSQIYEEWWKTKVARGFDYLLELSVHSWLSGILRFPMIITHESEASGYFVSQWGASNVKIVVYGIKHKAQRDYFLHLGCPVIVDNVNEMAQV